MLRRRSTLRAMLAPNRLPSHTVLLFAERQDIPCGVVFPMQARATHRARMPPDGQAFLDQDAAAGTALAGVGRRHGDHCTTVASGLVAQDAQEPTPPRSTAALGEAIIPDC